MDGLQLSNQNLGWMTAQYALTVVETGGRLIRHALLLVHCGRDPSNAAAVRRRGGEGRDAGVDGGIKCNAEQISMAALVGGEVYADAPGKGFFRGVARSPEAKPDRSGAAKRTLDRNQLKSLQGEVFRSIRDSK